MIRRIDLEHPGRHWREYPCTIFSDRYSWGGEWCAVAAESVPIGPLEGDTDAWEWHERNGHLTGYGNTPDEALASLKLKLMEGLD